MRAGDSDEQEYDFVIVGSGAGGGPLAANLAEAGFSVLILEAGGDDQPLEYDVPAFHGLATESPTLQWDYFVDHYKAGAERDRKFVQGPPDRPDKRGILYPRAGTLGGCTAHHALILLYPHNSDWDAIATLTGDSSWRSESMRSLFESMEDCSYRPKWLGKLTGTRHGHGGWLPTAESDARLLLKDPVLLAMVLQAVPDPVDKASSLLSRIEQAGANLIRRMTNLWSVADPNDWKRVRSSLEGVTLTPITTRDGRRFGARERIRNAIKARPDRLHLRLHCLATRVIFDESKRARGVEYIDGAHLYRADPNATDRPEQRQPRTVRARREVVLAGGSFSSPQLLMLSGIGRAEELARHGIPVLADLPGVGGNLQDRYEISVVYEVSRDLRILADASFAVPSGPGVPEAAFRDWQAGRGLYTTNGVTIARIERSDPSHPEPDLYLFGVPGRFEGYYPGWSQDSLSDKKHFTWVALKAHTRNTAGRVSLRSADPRDTPAIDFNYFEHSTDPEGEDLAALVRAVARMRQIGDGALGFTEVAPGKACDTPEKIAAYVEDNAWGHHACGTCRIGARDDPLAVLDSRFRVRGVDGLRVVDASVFPRIPGFFIVCAVYMASEKASRTIIADNRS